MSTTNCAVLLIEDDPKKGAEIEKALRKALGPRLPLERLDMELKEKSSAAYEDRLFDLLNGNRYRDLSLIVTDRDLSRSTRWPGLSEAVVTKAAGRCSIPIGVYASGKADTLLERQKSGGDGRIILDPADREVMARKVAALATGFRRIRTEVERIGKSKRSRKEFGGPASVLAHVLAAPESVDHLTLYTRGDQRMIAELMPIRSGKAKVEGPTSSDIRRVSVALGVWLYDSVLRFPGVIVDGIAAASFLAIDEKAFASPTVQKVFREALYKGPFYDPKEPRWWRHKLARLIQGAGVPDGRALAGKVTGTPPKPCQCSFDGKTPAGFLCVMTGAPVCEEHSVSQVSWLPRGADLARVRQDLFEQIGPWIGMS